MFNLKLFLNKLYFFLNFKFNIKCKPVSVIVAHNNMRGIGNFGFIPWFIPEDLTYFKRLTTGNIVIMGRKTFASLDYKPLSKRMNIVITSQSKEYKKVFKGKYSNLIFCDSLFSALINAQKNYQISPRNEIYVIGGSQIYEQMIENYCFLLKYIYSSIIDNNVECDTYFPYYVHFSNIYKSEYRFSRVGGVAFRHYKSINNLYEKFFT